MPASVADIQAELLAYEMYVAQMAALADGRVINNSSIEHAAIIIAQIFKTSKQNVDILTGCLDARVYGSDRVCAAAKAFLSQEGSSIRVLSERPVEDGNGLVAIAGEHMKVKLLPEKVQTPSHFTIGDRQHIRFESDKKTCNASAMFGVEEAARGLSDAFGSIFEASA